MTDIVQLTLSSFLQTLLAALWFIAPIFLIALFWKIRLYYIRSEFLKNTKWAMLEIKFPADNVRTPKAMEHVFSTIWGMYSFGIKSLDKYLDGKVELWVSCELVGRADGIHFFMRVPEKNRNMVEAALYAQYPEAEISEGYEYTSEFSSFLPDERYDVFGASFSLVKPNPYPIRTYEFFEERNDIRNEKSIDPLAPLFEVMSKLKGEEQIWIQLLVSPAGSATGVDIRKDAEKEIKELLEKKGFKPTEEGKPISLSGASMGLKDIVQAIESKVSKQIFEITMRFVYVDTRETFSAGTWSAVMAAFQQFNTQTLNALKPGAMPFYGSILGKFFPWWKNYKVLAAKRMIYDAYVARWFGMTNRFGEEKLPILNTEELATLFHASSNVVRAPRLQKIDSRKGSPPPNIPLA
jgi:hypothetical protein